MSDPDAIALAWTGGDVWTAETMTELTARLIDGYDPGDAERALVARFDHLAGVAGAMQALILSDSSAMETLSDDDLNIALVDKRLFAEPVTWTAQMPLIVLATGYAPYTSTPLPKGNIVALDPYSERTFLQSFVALGLAKLLTR